MKIIEWCEDFSVHIETIDEQHKTLISLINELNLAMKYGKEKKHCANIINGLFEYIKTHFTTEEGILEQHNYPQLAEHKKEHDLFIDKILEFKTDLKIKQVCLSEEILEFLSTWLIDHIQGTDKKYATFLSDQGV